MDYKEFCAPFYNEEEKALSGLKGEKSQRKIGEFFVWHSLPEDKANELLSYSDDTYRRWFTGERKVQIWSDIADCFDEIGFTKALAVKLNDKTLPRIFEAYGIQLAKAQEPDKYVLAAAMAEQFLALAEGDGEADNVLFDAYKRALVPEEFPAYIDASYDKFCKLKTLLYTNEERPFDEFFVCNTVRTEEYYFRKRMRSSDKVIKDVTLDKLLEKARYCILIGMGGIGKSMMMRHLFLEAIKDYRAKKSDRIPIMVILREYGVETHDLFELVVRSVKRFDASIERTQVNKLLLQGKCQILLDGLDEIKSVDMESFLSQLDYFNDQYTNNQVVISSRRFASFVGLSRYRLLWMERFSKEQALELIDKLKYYEEESRLKERFKNRLRTDLFDSHAEFATNPLLLTLMYMNFRIFTDVPEKQHKFYRQAYETLLQRHDGDKLTMTRAFHSVKDTSDFTDVFAEFCARSYRKGDYEFDDDSFKHYFEILHSTEKLDPVLMKVDNFKFDALHSSCLMYEEGQRYHFLHRSFQEYFFAEYYSRQDDTTVIKLGRSLREPAQNRYDESEAFNMLYELAADKVERFIFLPFLEEIYEEKNAEKSYWTFLRSGYSGISYTLYNHALIKEKYGDSEMASHGTVINSPSTVIMFKMLDLLKIEPDFIVDYSGKEVEYPDNVIGVLLAQEVTNTNDMKKRISVLNLPIEFYRDSERFEKSALFDFSDVDDDGRPIIVGNDYGVKYDLIINNPEKYSELKVLLEQENTEFRQTYNRLSKYYTELRERYKNSDNLDDDDF